MLYQEFRLASPMQPVQVNILSHIDTHSDVYYSTQSSQADMFLHTLLSPNESVWEDPLPSGPYRPLQNHAVSAPTSYNNVYSEQYPYPSTTNISPMEAPSVYAQPWTAPGPGDIAPVTASPVSPLMPTSPNEESSNEPKIRRNNYSLLVYNHQFPALEVGLPP
jgi:hypothetical protein